MSRSGNHAIINWILNQLNGRYVFLNCAEPKENPFTSARPMGNGDRYETNIHDFELQEEREGQFRPKDVLLYSYEDCFLGMIQSDEFARRRDEFVGPSGKRLDVLILRDPFNLFASRRRKGNATVTPRTERRIWKQHAREFLGTPRYLDETFIAVNYNAWAGDRSYRRRLADELGIEFTDAAIDEIPPCNGGSSFDARRFDGRASEMKVYERWRHYADSETYWETFDEEMLELTEDIFGSAPGLESLPDSARLSVAA